jgi:23S rRNA (cytidine1920-2'-O)/16S rRNA (cytidine1409-2'-O)-methyltransferase
LSKERIDILLVQNGLFITREKAKAAIMAGIVYIDNERIDKPGEKVDVTKEIIVKGNTHPYVGRGGLKLEKALDVFQINLTGKTMIDIGASTGGFTDCALQNGARHVYAVDVGYGQLDWKLRSDSRVTVLERTNFRYLEVDKLDDELPEIATIDVSFISLKIIFPKLAEILKPNGYVVALIKPQFEAGKESVGKKGIVRDAKVHKQVLHDVIQNIITHQFTLQGLTYSPITGGDGNIEFLAVFKFEPTSIQEGDEILNELELNSKIDDVIQAAHNNL